MEFALPTLSATRETGPRLLFRRLGSEVAWDDFERNKLLLRSLSWGSGTMTDALLSRPCSASAVVSSADVTVVAVVGVEAGDGLGGGGYGRLELRRAFEKRLELLEKALGLNRPAVA